jgi:multiple sugar transport system substrate-binding protein
VRARVRIVAACSILFLVVAACSGGETPESDGVVTVLVSGDPAELEAYRSVARAFEAEQADVGVELVEVAERDELVARLSTSIAGGEPPDVFLLNYRYYAQFAARGAIEPVEPYLRGSTVLPSDAFFPEAMAPFVFDGTQMCLPQNVSSLVVYFNRDLFADAGVAEPVEGWTWREMVARGVELTRDADGDRAVATYGLGVEPEIIRLAPFIWSNGGELVDPVEEPARFALGAPAAAEALQLFLDLRSVHGIVPSDEELESRDLESRFLDGTVAMLMESRRVTPTFRTITEFEWDVAPLPVLLEPAGILHSDAYCMAAASGDHDVAWRFLEFALGPNGQRIAAETGRTVPSLVGVANSSAFLDPAEPPASSHVFLDAIPTLRAVPIISTWPEIEDVVNGLLEEAFYEGGEVGELVEEIVLTTEPLFARAATVQDG